MEREPSRAEVLRLLVRSALYIACLAAFALLSVASIEASVFEQDTGRATSVWEAVVFDLTPGDDGVQFLMFWLVVYVTGLSVFSLVVVVGYVCIGARWMWARLRGEEIDGVA